MPLVKISIKQERTSEQKNALLNAVHSALVEEFRVPETDRNQRISEYLENDFEKPPRRTDKYTLIEITIFPGRSAETKKDSITLL